MHTGRLVAALIVTCSQLAMAPAPPPPSQVQAVPGVSLGTLRLGVPKAALPKTFRSAGESTRVLDDAEHRVVLGDDGHVAQISRELKRGEVVRVGAAHLIWGHAAP